MAVAGCPKGRTDFNQGRKAQDLHDYDAAFEYYQKALKTDPDNAEYDGWLAVRNHSSYHNDTITDRIAP